MSIHLSSHCNSPELSLSSQLFPQQQFIDSFIFKLLLLKCKDFLHIQQKNLLFLCTLPLHFTPQNFLSPSLANPSWLMTVYFRIAQANRNTLLEAKDKFHQIKGLPDFHPLCCLTLSSLKYFCFLVGILVSFSFEFPCSLLSFMFVFFYKRFLIFFWLKPLYCMIYYIIYTIGVYIVYIQSFLSTFILLYICRQVKL